MGAMGFTLIGKAISYLPYFLLGLRNLGEKGLSLRFRERKREVRPEAAEGQRRKVMKP